MKKALIPIFLFLLIVPGIGALIHPGFFPTDDGNWMIIRFSAFYEAFRHGQFPVRFLPRLNSEYGYPVADFLYPLFMYIGIPIHILGVNFVNTIKIIFAISLLLSGLFSYFWLKKIFSQASAFAGALAYALFPYHLWDIYTRGSVGEILALAIVPFILWQIERRSIALISFGIALLILAHNVIALLCLPIIFLYMFFSKYYSAKQIVIVFFMGLGASVFFWFPALFDKQYTVFDKTIVSHFADYFIYPVHYPLYGYVSVVAIPVSIYGLWKQKKMSYWFIWIGTILSIFVTLPISYLLWKVIPGTNLIQFPFRILSLTMLGIAFLVALCVNIFRYHYKWVFSFLFIIITYVSAIPLFNAVTHEVYPDSYYSTNVDTTTVQNEYMPIWVHKVPLNLPNEKVFIANGHGSLSNIFSNGNDIQFTANLETQSIIQINTLYFPGWIASIDRKRTRINATNALGVIQLLVPQGIHTIVVKFTETTIRLIADCISLFSGILLVFFLFKGRKKHEIS